MNLRKNLSKIYYRYLGGNLGKNYHGNLGKNLGKNYYGGGARTSKMADGGVFSAP